MLFQQRAMDLIAFVLVFVGVATGLAACASASASSGSTAKATNTPLATDTALPTFPPPTDTATPGSTDGCPAPWPGEPQFSSSVLSGSVSLPPKTRIVVVNLSPGAEDAILCTLAATSSSIGAFMTSGLKAKAWHFDSSTGEWLQNGSSVEVSFSVSNPLNWDLSCICSGF